MGVRIQELPETTGIKKEDVLIVEDGQGTKKGTVQQLDETLGVSQLKEDLIKQLELQEFYKQKTVRSVQGYYDADLKGIGTLVSKLPPIITSIEINTIIKGTGSAKLEFLDENKNIGVTSNLVTLP